MVHWVTHHASRKEWHCRHDPVSGPASSRFYPSLWWAKIKILHPGTFFVLFFGLSCHSLQKHWSWDSEDGKKANQSDDVAILKSICCKLLALVLKRHACSLLWSLCWWSGLQMQNHFTLQCTVFAMIFFLKIFFIQILFCRMMDSLLNCFPSSPFFFTHQRWKILD